MILDIHLHTFFSDGIHSPLQMAGQVKKLGLGGFAVTDHNTVKGQRAAKEAAKKLKLAFIPGIEVSSIDGHIVGLFIEENIEPKLSAQETVERIHDLGGVAIAAHPYDFFRPSLGDKIKEVKFDYIEVHNARVPLPISNFKAQRVAHELGAKGTVASDAHSIEEVGYGTIQIQRLDDIRKGNVKIKNAKWAWPWLIAYGKVRRVLRKHGLY